MPKAELVMRLELIAAKAKQMAEDEKADRLWPEDHKAGLEEITRQLASAFREIVQ